MRDETWLVGALARGRWIVLGVLAASLLAATALTATQTPLYRAETALAVRPNSEVDDPADVLRALETLERRTILVTLARIPTSRPTRQAVEGRLGEDALHGYDLRASPVAYANLIRIEVTGPDRDRATEIAAAVGERTRRTGRSLYRIYSLETFEPARAGGTPVSPDWGRNLVVAALLGAVIGVGVALWVHGRSRR